MVAMATMVYAVLLDLRLEEFRHVARHPLAVGVGLAAQFVLLPVATLVAKLALDLPPGVLAVASRWDRTGAR